MGEDKQWEYALLKAMECTNTFRLWKSVIFSAMDDELWRAPFADEPRWIESVPYYTTKVVIYFS